MKYIGPFMQWNTVQRLENIMYCKIPLKEKYNLHIKAELLVIVSSGESGMGQGGPYPGGGAASAQAGYRSARQHSVTILHASGPPAPQSLPPPRVSLARMQSWTLDPRGKPCSALAPTMAFAAGFLQTLTGLVTYRKKSNKVPPPACLLGSNLKQTQQPTGWVNPQTTVASARARSCAHPCESLRRDSKAAN